MTFREKILEMVAILVCPFDQMIADTKLDGLEDVPSELIPAPAQKLLTFIKEKFTANRIGYEDAIVAVVEKHLTENDVESILAFNKSAVGRKLRSLNMQIQNDLSDANISWRNSTMESHIEEFRELAGVTEPAPLED